MKHKRSQLVCAGLAATFAAVLCGAASTAAWQKEEPAQWTTEEVYQILNNSAWSKTANVILSRQQGYEQGRGGGGTWGEGGPGMGPMGGGGFGGRGMGRNRGPASTQQGPSVTVQWASALPVRLAEAKSSGGAVDAAAMKPLDEYVIAVIGFPKSGFEPQSMSSDPGSVPDDAELADHLKVITTLAFGQQRLNPAKVELDQGRDGRALFHFEKTGDGTPDAKSADFRIRSDHAELEKKFNLKDMDYQGKPAL